ncbi:unnamed protein product [Tuber melanosporum]|uniref:(Perigord truffle) hypothetical protein n=1 Tax=Tuber melanosporum (strain Mel28) TaxID=656061 RepID=D5GAM7_TUBMM|nr:uncharacterized protein GSTUM_00003687001 [Tuber melanosporum]CAZ81570.1 unnamed protein product [Tuber melanosporum]
MAPGTLLHLARRLRLPNLPLLPAHQPTLLRSHLLRNLRQPLRPSFSTAKTTPPPPAKPATLSARLKHLSREYGYSALGVYLLLSALDFPFSFLAVRYLGTERIGELEASVIGFVKPYWVSLRSAVGYPPAPVPVGDRGVEVEGGEGRWESVHDAEGEVEKAASIWTELALAYAIHKSFIFIRVPLTAAVTPKAVKVLRGWGWDIGKKGGAKEAVKKARRGD